MPVNGNPSDDWKFREAYEDFKDWEMWKEWKKTSK